MNKKLVRGSLAGVAAIALAAGGTTFAAWSDWDTLTGSHAGADQLTLQLGQPNSSNFDDMHLAPGGRGDYEFVVAGRLGSTVKDADHSMQLTDLVGHEDGCTSTNSELAVDSDCDDTTTAGEFIRDAQIIVNTTAPTTNPNACDEPHGSRQSAISLADFRKQTATTPLNLLPAGTHLEKNQYVCVAMGLVLPEAVNNASQGDSADFNLKFLLDQVV
jgi:hypothetical protein